MKKLISLQLLSLILGAAKSSAWIYTPTDLDGLFSLNEKMACVVNDNVMKCYDVYNTENKNVYELKNIEAVNLASPGACIITLPDHTLECGSELPTPYKNPLSSPPLKNVQSASIGSSMSERHFATCSLDDSGAHCWKQPPSTSSSREAVEIPLPVFKNPRQVSVDPSRHRRDFEFCVLDDEGGHCFDSSDSVSEPNKVFLPEQNPIQIAIASGTICLMGTREMKCKKPYGPGQREFDIPVSHPTQMSISQYSVCVLDDDGVECWDTTFRFNKLEKYEVPELKNPKAIAVATYFPPDRSYTSVRACAIDDKGLNCWTLGQKNPNLLIPDVKVDTKRNKPSVKKPSFNLDQLDSYLDILTKVSSPARTKFFRQLNDFVGPQLIRAQGPLNDSRYLQVKLISPAVLSSDSKFAVESLIPRFKNSLQSIENDLEQNDLSKVAPTSMNRKVALHNIYAALNVLKEFLPSIFGNGKINRALGLALNNPSDENIRIVLTELNTIRPKLKVLEANPKAAFLVETILLAQEWLGRK